MLLNENSVTDSFVFCSAITELRDLENSFSIVASKKRHVFYTNSYDHSNWINVLTYLSPSSLHINKDGKAFQISQDFSLGQLIQERKTEFYESISQKSTATSLTTNSARSLNIDISPRSNFVKVSNDELSVPSLSPHLSCLTNETITTTSSINSTPSPSPNSSLRIISNDSRPSSASSATSATSISISSASSIPANISNKQSQLKEAFPENNLVIDKTKALANPDVECALHLLAKECSSPSPSPRFDTTEPPPVLMNLLYHSNSFNNYKMSSSISSNSLPSIVNTSQIPPGAFPSFRSSIFNKNKKTPQKKIKNKARNHPELSSEIDFELFI